MAKTLLAVDDSVTMRKVLEITFSGEDFRVVTADTSQAALGKLSENPNVCIIDTVLGGEDGYALAKEVRKRSPGAAILLLASRYAPYDQARGRDSGADDYADKPFDTQQLIDKVKKVALARENAAPLPAAAGAAPSLTPASGGQRPPPPPFGSGAPQSLGKSTQPSLGGAVPGRSGTLVFGENPGGPASFGAAALPRPATYSAQPASAQPVSAQPASAQPVSAQPASAHVNAHPTPPAPPTAIPEAASPIAGAVNGQLAAKLGGLGLTPQQADAVLALSREVVERIVWEVVPQLAEAIIKEEIARLTRD